MYIHIHSSLYALTLPYKVREALDDVDAFLSLERKERRAVAILRARNKGSKGPGEVSFYIHDVYIYIYIYILRICIYILKIVSMI